MTPLYLLDANAISALINTPDGRMAQRVALVGGADLCTSVVVAAELRYGAAKRESARLSRRVDEALRDIAVMALQPPADRLYAETRSGLERAGTPIGDRDLLIAAHALALDCILVTDNTREFERVPGLRFENWLRPV